jgi:hypothetical protein
MDILCGFTARREMKLVSLSPSREAATRNPEMKFSLRLRGLAREEGIVIDRSFIIQLGAT